MSIVYNASEKWKPNITWGKYDESIIIIECRILMSKSNKVNSLSFSRQVTDISACKLVLIIKQFR